MKPVRLVKKKQISDALSKEMGGVPGFLMHWGNTILTTALIAASVVLLVRWRIMSAEQSRLELLNSLTNAREYVAELRPGNLPIGTTPQYLAGLRADHASRASAEITSLLDSTTDPNLKAQALITRGNLYWQLANFPELPGAATQPSLRSSETRDELLTKAADAYNEVLKTDAYVKQQNAMVSAHFGLAAIAENRGEWDSARKELEIIANNTDGIPVLIEQAKQQLAELPKIESPLYLAPATQPVTEALLPPAPTTQPMATTAPAPLSR